MLTIFWYVLHHKSLGSNLQNHAGELAKIRLLQRDPSTCRLPAIEKPWQGGPPNTGNQPSQLPHR